jgi:hypothetical protein
MNAAKLPRARGRWWRARPAMTRRSAGQTGRDGCRCASGCGSRTRALAPGAGPHRPHASQRSRGCRSQRVANAAARSCPQVRDLAPSRGRARRPRYVLRHRAAACSLLCRTGQSPCRHSFVVRRCLRPDGSHVVVTERSTCVICTSARRGRRPARPGGRPACTGPRGRRLPRTPDGLAVRRRPSRASSSANHSNGDHSQRRTRPPAEMVRLFRSRGQPQGVAARRPASRACEDDGSATATMRRY